LGQFTAIEKKTGPKQHTNKPSSLFGCETEFGKLHKQRLQSFLHIAETFVLAVDHSELKYSIIFMYFS
jgi:hypothetical protein